MPQPRRRAALRTPNDPRVLLSFRNCQCVNDSRCVATTTQCPRFPAASGRLYPLAQLVDNAGIRDTQRLEDLVARARALGLEARDRRRGADWLARRRRWLALEQRPELGADIGGQDALEILQRGAAQVGGIRLHRYGEGRV